MDNRGLLSLEVDVNTYWTDVDFHFNPFEAIDPVIGLQTLKCWTGDKLNGKVLILKNKMFDALCVWLRALMSDDWGILTAAAPQYATESNHSKTSTTINHHMAVADELLC